jgi:hypothetical protein
MAARKTQKTTRTPAMKTTSKARGQKKAPHNAKPSVHAAHAAENDHPAAKLIEVVGDTLSHIGEKAIDGGRRVQAAIAGSSSEG